MKFGAIIEARMTSTRLPGKILYEAAGKSFLQHLINRLKKVDLPTFGRPTIATIFPISCFELLQK